MSNIDPIPFVCGKKSGNVDVVADADDSDDNDDDDDDDDDDSDNNSDNNSNHNSDDDGHNDDGDGDSDDNDDDNGYDTDNDGKGDVDNQVQSLDKKEFGRNAFLFSFPSTFIGSPQNIRRHEEVSFCVSSRWLLHQSKHNRQLELVAEIQIS